MKTPNMNKKLRSMKTMENVRKKDASVSSLDPICDVSPPVLASETV